MIIFSRKFVLIPIFKNYIILICEFHLRLKYNLDQVHQIAFETTALPNRFEDLNCQKS